MDFLLKLGQKNKMIMEIAQALALPGEVSANVITGARPYFLALLSSHNNRPFFVLTFNDEQAKVFATELNHYKTSYYLPKLIEHEDPYRQSLRLKSLIALKNNTNPIVCTSIKTLIDQQVASKDLVGAINVKMGQKISLETLASKLVEAGYSHEYQVEAPSQFSIRGNICDIFPVGSDYPVRIEFFGDSVEEMRYFSFLDQHSLEKIKEVNIEPCAIKETAKTAIGTYINKDTIIVMEDKSLLQSSIDEFNIKIPSTDSILDLSILSEKSRFQLTGFFNIDFNAGQFENILAFLRQKQQEGFLIVLNVKEVGKKARLKEMLHSWHFFSEDLRPNLAILFPMVLITDKTIERSFVWPDAKIAVVSDADIFVRQLSKLPPKLYSGTARISNFTDLKTGDYLVHINHGIALYKGLETKIIDGVKREYLKLSYAGGDKLFVPVTEMDRVSRYIGSGNKPPVVSRLGSNQWALTKKKVNKSVRKLAINLLNLYAKRSQAKAFKYSADTPWQKQLEDDFPFEETMGQFSAIDAVKQDMQSHKPMDRLICGDVGFGKTEVALRAAFKAVQDGKQVLFLVPTTILAQQHFNSFTARLSPYPVILEMLSRFKTKSEQQKIVSDINGGKIDIIIGTHRLLQKDIIPKDLGLIVVDEEQRFGVTHKEKLKNIKSDVDVLTLTATPIPRTLQMALSGIRDLSVIETPPNNRHPIITHVGPYEAELTKKAINKELTRGGQVFYLYNEVQTIESIAGKLKELVPDAKIVIAHGQLKERQLEKTMLGFIEGKYNVLVTTTIIESGIDVSSANTLIVDRAEKFGLAQLYQIRGRVGRSTDQAYAYLFYRRHLTETALERLKTLADYTALGSGYRIALRDLEIRGAGNLLGAEQSGHIASVGFDLYTHLLQNAVEELRGAEPRQKPIARDLPITAFIPKSYVAEESIRIDFYQRLAAADNKETFEEILLEIKDRFGKPPKEVENLKRIALLKFKP